MTYGYDAAPELVVVCHCGHCQHGTGSAFSVNILVPRDALTIHGEMQSYQTTGQENGNLRDRMFCGSCGTPIFTYMHDRPDLMIVKAGTLDDPSGLQPAAEVWWRRAQDWLPQESPRTRFDGDAR